jgi:CheY-like chemotaxis protein
MKVLIVDDCADSTFLLSQLLEKCGHESHSAQNAHEALAIVSECQPDAIFLDLALPGESGYELAVKLRSCLGLKETLIVALSGYTDDLARREAAGINAHLLKPASVQQLCDILEGWRNGLIVV